MAIIYSYPLNDDIKPLDELVGTTQQTINGQLKTVTRNFLLADIAEFLIIDGGIQKTLTLTTNGTGGVSTLDQVTGILNIPHYPGDLKVASLFKETFEYTGSNLFPLINTINNVLQVIVNTTSLHPVAYSVELPNIVNVLNELYSGDTITIIYNYLEEVVETPNLQSVTDEGNHTTNNIIIDNIPGEWGSYTASNTLNELGAFQSFTSPTSSPDYQTTYAGYEMSISEIYTPIERKEVLIYSGIIQASYINGSNYNALRLNSGDNSNGPSFYIEKNNINGQLRIDNLIGNTILQFPAKPTGTYTIATTDDVSPNYWTKTGNDIVNNNTGKVEIISQGDSDWDIGTSVFMHSANYNNNLYISSENLELRGRPSTGSNFGNLYLGGGAGDSEGFLLIGLGISEINAQLNSSGSYQKFRFDPVNSQATFTDTTTTPKGIQYAADYSANYTNRSLVDKGYVNNRLVVETTSGYTLTNADSGGIVIFTASTTLTIPTGLADGFECTFVTLAGATLTVSAGANTLYNNTSTTLLPQLSFTLKRRIATDQYIATGNL